MEKKYIVKVINVFSNLIAVDANNEEEAKEKAKELLVNKPDGEEFEHLYESTTAGLSLGEFTAHAAAHRLAGVDDFRRLAHASDHWAVITKEDFDKLKEDFAKSLEPQEKSGIITP